VTTSPQPPARASVHTWWRRLGSGEGPGLVAVLVAFFQERVDKVFVDGEEIERPNTPWAR